MSSSRASSEPAKSKSLALVPCLLAMIGAPLAAEESTTPAPKPKPEVTVAPSATSPDQQGSLVVTGESDEQDFKTDSSRTATKMDLPLQQTPQSVAVIPEDLIDARGSFSLRETLRSASGVTLGAGEGGRTGDSITIRGFSANSDFYVDGMKDNGQYFRDTFEVEQVEVLKGPSSVLFGRGSTGGAINTVTKKPTDAWTGEAALTAGTYDLLRASAGVGGPLSGDDLMMRFDAYAHDAESFRDEQELRRWGVAPGVASRLGESTELRLQVMHQDEKSTMDYGVPIWNGRPADVPIDTYYGFKDDSFQEYDDTRYTATIEHRFDEAWSVRNMTRWADYERFYRTEVIGAADPLTAEVPINQALRLNEQRNVLNQTDVTWRTKADERAISVTGGVEFGREYYDFKSKDSLGEPNVSIFDPQQPSTVGPGRANDFSGILNSDNHTDADTFAAYAIAAVDITKQWKAILGLRWDRYKAEFDNDVLDESFERTDRMGSPRAALVYTPVEQLSVYASYSTSFNPSAEAYSLSLATESLEPEENVNYEIGGKLSLLEDHLAIACALFRLEKTNARTTDPTNVLLQVLDGKTRTDGVEMDITGKITDRWNIFAGAALLDAEVVESNNVTVVNGVPIETEGKDPINAPELAGSVWTTYDVGRGFTAGLGAFYQSSWYTNAANTTELPSYWRVDASLAYARKIAGHDWFAQLNVFNVLDEEYYEAGSANSAYPGAPITGQLTVGAKF
jgi:catecholate siderophore receptor